MNNLQDKHDKVQKLLQDYPIKVGLGSLAPNNDVQKFLTVTQSEIRRMSAEECGEASVILNQAATYIQLEINRVQADIDWCEQYIHFLISDTIANCGSQYTPFEYRKEIAIKQNDVATKLKSIVVQAQLRLQVLSYMPNQLRATSLSFSNLQQTKRHQSC